MLLIKSAKCCLFIRSEGTNQVFNILQHEWLGLVLMRIKMTKLPMMTRSGEEKSISDFKALCRYSLCKSLELNARVNQHCNIQTNIFWIKVPHQNQRLFCSYYSHLCIFRYIVKLLTFIVIAHCADVVVGLLE